MTPLPKTPEEITADWLTGVLAQRYPGTRVTAVVIGTIVRGSGTKIRVMLDYNEAGHAHALPTTVWIKTLMEDHGLARHANLDESLFYRDIEPRFKIGNLINIPKCYFAGVDDTGHALMILEDLLARNASFGHALKPVSHESVRAGLDMFARLHAKFWGSSELGDLEWIKNGGALASDGMFETMFAPAHWDRCLELPRAQYLTPPMRDRSTMLTALKSMQAAGTKLPQTLLHGDPHVGNTFYERDGRPGLLDWQTSMIGPWVHDVTYFTVGSLSVDDRRAHLFDLIAHYLERLSAYGAPAPRFDDAVLTVRRQLMHGCCWLICPPEMQAESVISTCSERFVTAATDLDMLGSLR
jgi:hypothetical protein